MKRVRLDEIARGHMREIRAYSLKAWGGTRADAYVRQLSERFDDIASGRVHSRSVAAIFGIDGYFCPCGSHFIYWRALNDDAIAIVAVLHQRMHQRERVRIAFQQSP